MFKTKLFCVSREFSRRANSSGLINRLLPAACRVSVAAVATTLLLLGAPSGYALVQIGETFTGGLGYWTTTSPANTDAGNNWIWSSSGGPFSGAIGGTLVRTNVPTSPTAFGMPRFLDTVSFAGGNTMNLNMALSVSGQMYLNDPGTADTGIYVGYFNSAAPDVQRLALKIDGPNPRPQWRVRFAGNASTGTRTALPDATWNAALLDFAFNFVPDGGGLGAGTVSGYVKNGAATWTVTTFGIAANTSFFDAFGIWADSSSSTDVLRTQTGWFDNIQYTVVPEPSAALLLPLGAGLLLLTQRTLRRK